jgi:hypothetical protein
MTNDRGWEPLPVMSIVSLKNNCSKACKNNIQIIAIPIGDNDIQFIKYNKNKVASLIWDSKIEFINSIRVFNYPK